MYPECRHVKPSGRLCDSPALSGSNWCYFHRRLHERQLAGQAAHAKAFGRARTLEGRFTPALSDTSPQPDTERSEAGAYPVGEDRSLPAPEQTPLDLPPFEDAASIQLALIDVAQALAANRIDPRRAGLLLYAMQVASTNARHLDLSSSGVRSLTYTGDGLPLAPQEYGWDLEDIEEEIEREDNGDDEDEAEEDEL